MNKGQKIVVSIAALILEIVLLGGAFYGSRSGRYDVFDLDLFSKDIRVYIAIALIGVAGYFLFGKRFPGGKKKP